MIIESITPCTFGGVFVMFILANGTAHEMHLASAAEAIGYMNAANAFSE